MYIILHGIAAMCLVSQVLAFQRPQSSIHVLVEIQGPRDCISVKGLHAFLFDKTTDGKFDRGGEVEGTEHHTAAYLWKNLLALKNV